MQGHKEQVATKSPSVSISEFKKIGEQLEHRYRKYDDINKISRDITWESKKIISMLLGHVKDPKVLKNANSRISAMLKSPKHFQGLACMLHGEDQYFFARAFSSGVQEFVEALALYTFFTKKSLVSYDETVNMLRFKVPDLKINKSEALKNDNEKNQEESKPPEMIDFQLQVSRGEFLMGLTDVPGELVRACASGVYNKNFKPFLFDSCLLVRSLFTCMQCIYPYSRELVRKMKTMKSSLLKLELACYDTIMNRYLGSVSLVLSSKHKEIEFEDTEDSGYD